MLYIDIDLLHMAHKVPKRIPPSYECVYMCTYASPNTYSSIKRTLTDIYTDNKLIALKLLDFTYTTDQ